MDTLLTVPKTVVVFGIAWMVVTAICLVFLVLAIRSLIKVLKNWHLDWYYSIYEEPEPEPEPEPPPRRPVRRAATLEGEPQAPPERVSPARSFSRRPVR